LGVCFSTTFRVDVQGESLSNTSIWTYRFHPTPPPVIETGLAEKF
jgi:hypothetical protein